MKIQLPDADAEIEPVPTTGGGLASGASVTMVLEFAPTGGAITYTAHVLDGNAP